MRILQVIRSLSFGGAENHVLSLLLGLRARGHDVLLASPINSWIGKQCTEYQIPVEDIPMRGIYDLFSYWKLHRLIKSWNADIVHAHQVRPSQYVGISSKGTSAIPICTAHSTGVHKHMQRCRHIIAVSDAVAQNLKNKNYSPSIITRIYNGVDDIVLKEKKSLREQLGIPDTQFTVVCAGRFHRDKGQDILVKAAEFCSNDIHFYFFGDDETEYGRTVKQSAQNMKNIHFLGYKNHVSQILHAFDVYASPSRREAFSLSLAEAEAARLPIIASRVGGIPEVVEDRISGVLVEVENAQAFASAIQKLFADANLRFEMGKQARLRYEQNFTVERMITQTEDVYRKLLK